MQLRSCYKYDVGSTAEIEVNDAVLMQFKVLELIEEGSGWYVYKVELEQIIERRKF